MHIHETWESLAYNNRWSRIAVLDKALLCGALLMAAWLMPPWPAAVPLAVFAGALACWGAGVRWSTWLRAISPMVFLIAVAVVPVIWSSPDRARDAGLRAVAAGSATVLFVLTTPAPEAIAALPCRNGMAPLVELAFLALRFAAVVTATAHSVAVAWRCRGGESGTALMRSAAQAAASLAARSLDRGARAEQALWIRGGDGSVRLWSRPRQPSRVMRWTASAICLCAAGIKVWLV